MQVPETIYCTVRIFKEYTVNKLEKFYIYTVDMLRAQLLVSALICWLGTQAVTKAGNNTAPSIINPDLSTVF